jgi:hypothetical protein
MSHLNLKAGDRVQAVMIELLPNRYDQLKRSFDELRFGGFSDNGGPRGLSINHLQRLPALSPGPPRHNYGTPNLSSTHSRHTIETPMFRTATVKNRTRSNDRRVSAKVLALIAHLRTAFGTPPYWER